MPLSLPPKEEDHSKASWYLELVREINRLEAAINNLEARVRELEDN